MIITDYKKLEQKYHTYPQIISTEAQSVFEELGNLINQFPYEEPHHKLLLKYWRMSESDVAEMLDYNPSTIGNKRGRMTKQIESIIDRTTVKRFNKINDSITKCHTHNKDVDLYLLDDLDEIHQSIMVASFQPDCDFHDGVLDSVQWHQQEKLSKPDKTWKDIDYTLMDIQPILKVLREGMKQVYQSKLDNLDQDKLNYVLYLMNHPTKKSTDLYQSIVDFMQTDLPDNSNTSFESNIDSILPDPEVISEVYNSNE